MRERKNVKFRTDMYEDTKLKIIDRMPKRDLIHYILNRIIILAGKVNREGDLYMSKNIPYTIETLAIEFNRDEEDIKMALDIFVELEILEFVDNKIYRVKNFAKHQNIKVKEKSNNKEENMCKAIDKIIKTGVDKIEENKAAELKDTQLDEEVLEKTDKDINYDVIYKCDLASEENELVQHNNSSVIIEMKPKKKRKSKDRKSRSAMNNGEDITEINDDIIGDSEEDLIGDLNGCDEEDICTWSVGDENKVKDGDKLIAQWGF